MCPLIEYHRNPDAAVLLRFWKDHSERSVPLMLEVALIQICRYHINQFLLRLCHQTSLGYHDFFEAMS